MYIRFVVHSRSKRSGKRKGIFAAMGEFSRLETVGEEDFNKYREIADWFNSNFDMPGKFTRSTKPHAKPKAISWFKDSAKEYISRARELCELFEKHGIAVEMVKTDRPGYIVYESDYQVVAEPYNDTSERI